MIRPDIFRPGIHKGSELVSGADVPHMARRRAAQSCSGGNGEPIIVCIQEDDRAYRITDNGIVKIEGIVLPGISTKVTTLMQPIEIGNDDQITTAGQKVDLNDPRLVVLAVDLHTGSPMQRALYDQLERKAIGPSY